jgi:chorismate mutase/prephenate dehydratase
MSAAKKIKVAFCGEPGAFSQIAALEFFKQKIETLPCKSFKEVFEKVKKREADFGTIPIENSLEGSVGQNYDFLLKSNLKIFGEIILKINHCLIALPKTKINSIKKVYSHPQALGQCREFLEKMGFEKIPTSDTAGSVKLIKEKNLKDCAAIASERAAKFYQMKILKKNIQSNPQNFTRFFVISKKEAKPTKNDKTSIVFSTKHVPGALFSALRPFAKNKINLTKIESRPIIGKPWQYNFYLDFQGNQKEKRVKKALKELKKITNFVKILGSYPKSKKNF